MFRIFRKKKSNLFAYSLLGLAGFVIVSGFIYAEYLIRVDTEVATSDLYIRSDAADTASQAEAPFVIMTDKKLYQAGEPVVVKVINNTIKPMIQNASSTTYIKASRYLGANIGIGLIEKKLDRGWVAVESLWRCAGACNETCDDIPTIRPNEIKEFFWNQLLTICSPYEADLSSQEFAGSGIYRINIAVESPDQISNGLYSPEFKILERLDVN